jgi:hypothetical protein
MTIRLRAPSNYIPSSSAVASDRDIGSEAARQRVAVDGTLTSETKFGLSSLMVLLQRLRLTTGEL